MRTLSSSGTSLSVTSTTLQWASGRSTTITLSASPATSRGHGGSRGATASPALLLLPLLLLALAPWPLLVGSEEDRPADALTCVSTRARTHAHRTVRPRQHHGPATLPPSLPPYNNTPARQAALVLTSSAGCCGWWCCAWSWLA